MSTGISAVYSEFADALTEILAENAVGPGAAVLLGLTPPSRSTPTTATLDIFWRSKRHSRIGKPYKTPAARTPSQLGQHCG